MKILLIGGSGFMGRYVVDSLLASGHEVAVLHRGMSGVAPHRSIRTILGDANRLSDLHAELREFAPEVVVNFILSSARQAEELMRTFRGNARRVVVLSSMDVYRACGVLHETESGDLQSLPLTEESELRAQPAYTREQMEMGKKIFSWMTDEYEKISVERAVLGDPQLSATVLRLPMVYGPGDSLRRFLPIVKRIRDGRRKILLEQGTENWRASKGYVENVAHAIALLATSDVVKSSIYNVGEEDALTELEWAQLIAREMQWDGDFVVLPRARLPEHLLSHGNYRQHWVANSTRIRQELGYCERIPRNDAVHRTVQWELENPPQYLSEALFNYAAEDAA